jgi:hypothetical protein
MPNVYIHQTLIIYVNHLWYCLESVNLVILIKSLWSVSVGKLGPTLWFLKYFRPKNLDKIFAFVAQTTASFLIIITLFFWDKRQFFSPKIGKNRRKLGPLEVCSLKCRIWRKLEMFFAYFPTYIDWLLGQQKISNGSKCYSLLNGLRCWRFILL